MEEQIMEEQLTLLDRAIIFAAKAHAGAVRRDGHTPYILHCTEAAAIAATMTQDQEVLAAAVLHDVVEDTDVTAKTLEAEFGSRVAQLVGAMSENKRPELSPEDTWLVRKEETIAALEESTDLAVAQLYLADKLSNLRGIARDYEEYGDDLWEFFHQKSRAKQSWYYYRLETALEKLSDTDAFREFHRLRIRVFEHGE
jgi:GTP diphosphokinase / guanosine-3',5'-bis(diphosphate) 3'-diphosphatase